MSETVERIKGELLQLPISDRAELAQMLIESLDEIVDDDAEAAWDIEIGRRLEAIEKGTARGRPAENVLREIRGRRNPDYWKHRVPREDALQGC